MTPLELQFVNGARQIFDKFGKPVEVRLIANQAYVVKENRVSGDEQTFTVVGTPPFNFNGEWTSTLLVVGDSYIMVEAASVAFTMQPGIEVKNNGKWFTSYGVEPLTVGETVIAWIVKVRG